MSNFCPVPQPSVDIEARVKIYKYLHLCISLMPPAYFHLYYDLFEKRRYVDCFRILEALFCPGFKNEAEIVEIIKCKSAIHKDVPLGFVFYNFGKNKSFLVSRFDDEVVSEKCFFLPDVVLSFDMCTILYIRIQ